MKISIVQINPIIGDIGYNFKKMKDKIKEMAEKNSELIIFPELSLTGYPPRDLLYKKKLIKDIEEAIEELVALSEDYTQCGFIIGAPVKTGKKRGKGLYNAALLIADGKVQFQQAKSLLPTYDVFDETRYFDSSEEIKPFSFRGEKLGITVCEDIWNDSSLGLINDYERDPVKQLIDQGATFIINISASPFQTEKHNTRMKILKSRVEKYKVPFVYVNQVGGNDELIFDGCSFAINHEAGLIGSMMPFEEDSMTLEIKSNQVIRVEEYPDRITSIYKALILGLKDYLRKCGFKKAVIGLSGGIDSAVTCALAAAALGPENIIAITMPGPYSSTGSIIDSEKLAANLNIDFEVIAINELYNIYLKQLQSYFIGTGMDVTEENIQARIRGNILMAYSNKFGHIVLATGNKSELAVGYCTLYGDMSGGLSVLSDVPKTDVYRLAEKINCDKTIIPQSIMEKPPSAELKPDQKDQDSLPPYEILDKVLYNYIDENMMKEDIIDRGFDSEIVEWVINRVDKNEYKRRQAAPGLKITSKAFGMGRRMPVAARSEN
ncbi:MAG: NAD+ synthase [Halanaerobiaceae bacterium]